MFKIKRPETDQQEKGCRYAKQVVHLGDIKNDLRQGKRLQHDSPPGAAIQKIIRGKSRFNGMTGKGENIPEYQQDTVTTQIPPALADQSGGAAGMPVKIGQAAHEENMGHLVDIQPFRSAMGLKGLGVSGQTKQQKSNCEWNYFT